MTLCDLWGQTLYHDEFASFKEISLNQLINECAIKDLAQLP